jgi:serine/threonine-protein kinase
MTMKKTQALLLPAVLVGAASIFASGITRADNVYVVNNGGNSVSEISDGSVSTIIPSTPDLSSPTGIAVYGNNIYVANNGLDPVGGGYISEFTLGGVFEGDVATGLNQPRGMVVDSAGDLFVANYVGGSIVEIPSGGSAETIATNLDIPYGLTLDPSGNLYVTTLEGNSIDEITAPGTSGSTVTPFVTTGLNGPMGIAYDSVGANAGNFFVVDGGDSVLEFNSAGDPVTPSPFISGLSSNSSAEAIAIDSAGDFFITDNGDASVTEYDSNGDVLNVYNAPYAFDGPCFITTTLAVPEPSSYALLAGGLGLLLLFGRRKFSLV